MRKIKRKIKRKCKQAAKLYLKHKLISVFGSGSVAAVLYFLFK